MTPLLQLIRNPRWILLAAMAASGLSGVEVGKRAARKSWRTRATHEPAQPPAYRMH